MKIGEILRVKQPGVYKKLNERPKHRRDKKERLSFSYVENDLMTHDSYIRHRGAIAQRHWGK